MRYFFLILLQLQTLCLFAQSRHCFKKRAGATAVVFLAVDCPISQKYIPILNSIFEKYEGEKFDLIGVVPGKSTKASLATFRREFDIRFPLQADRSFECARSIDAKATPEVFLFADGKVVYRGAIDNWFYDLGGYRQDRTENYLVDAIETLLRNETPSVSTTEAIGCPINIPVQKHGKNL